MKLITRFILTLTCILFAYISEGVNKYSVTSGLWNNAASWMPAGIPQTGDDVHVMQGHSITVSPGSFSAHSITIRNTGHLLLSSGTILKIDSLLSVSGEVKMNNGDIEIKSGSFFELRDSAVFEWEPGTNTQPGASLFNNSTETFSPASNLIIKKWYDFNVPLATHISGNFGNLVLNSYQSNMILEWNQNNLFSSHQIIGTLTIGKGWIVLDKSGSMVQTEIGKIKLENTNSYLDFHIGNHPSTIKVITNEIYNLGGEINGIYNGNGNIELQVNDDVTNYGNIVLIRNAGVSGVSNGNAKLNVSGDFIQYAGDFRGIFNLTTFNSGTVDLTIHNLILKKGIFLAQYGCHTSGGTNRIRIENNLAINFSTHTSKFRATGLSSLAGTFNAAKTEFEVLGKTTLSGDPQAEFTSSGGSAKETFYAGDNFVVNGMRVNFNSGMHETKLHFNHSVSITGGNVSFSRMSGSVMAEIGENLIIQGGSLSLKEDHGPGRLNVNGDYIQSAGLLCIYSNPVIISGENLTMTVEGRFHQTGGQLNFCNNSSSLQPILLNLKSAEIIFNGDASVVRSGTAYGKITYSHQGEAIYKRLSGTHLINQIKTEIDSGCVLNIAAGNIQIASSLTPALDMLTVKNGSVLNMRESKILSNMTENYSGISVEDGGRISTQNTNGFFTGNENGCLSASGQMDFSLSPGSIIEYNGKETQTLTGISGINQALSRHKYGILEINLNSDVSNKKVILQSEGVFVRTHLILTKGELFLNNYPITIESGVPNAITAQEGYIKSDVNQALNQGCVKWMNLSTGEHQIPFGITKNELLPFTFNLKSGLGKFIRVSTRATGADNLPFPDANPPISGIFRNGKDVSVSNVIDRYYEIHADGIKADFTIYYSGKENTLAQLADQLLGIQCYENGKWSKSFGQGFSVINGTGQIKTTNTTTFGHWIISTPVSSNTLLDFISFNAELSHSKVNLSWEIPVGSTAIDYFLIQRRKPGESFNSLNQMYITDSQLYKFEDTDDLNEEGEYEYRIVRINKNGQTGYSDIERVSYFITIPTVAEIISVVPNPFRNFFELSYSVPRDGETDFSIISRNGQTVLSDKLKSVKGLNYYRFENSHNLSPGIYVLAIGYGSNLTTRKILKTD